MAGPTSFVFYRYQPSMVAAVIFIAGFGISTLLHLKTLIQKRTWYFIPFILGCLCEYRVLPGRHSTDDFLPTGCTQPILANPISPLVSATNEYDKTVEVIGYLGRAMSSNEYPDFTKNPYIIQSILLLLGPTLFAASIYMILGRLVVLLEAEPYSMIRPRWLTKVFVLGDLLSFFAQGGGGGMLTQAKSADDVKKGENIIIGGLFIQILFFGFFMIVALVFHRRISNRPTRAAMMIVAPWQQLVYVLYISSGLIMIRSVYRVAEYVMGSDGVLMSKEYYLYCLDALPMLLVALSYNYFHPGRVINKNSQDRRLSVSSLEVLGNNPC